MSTELAHKATVAELCGHRDRALENFRIALAAAERANKAAQAANPHGYSHDAPTLRLSSDRSSYYSDGEEEYRKRLDRGCWLSLLKGTGLRDVMSANQKADFRDGVEKDPPPFTMENVFSTFGEMLQSADKIFHRSVVDAFAGLDRDYVSNDGFKIGARMVFTHAVSVFIRPSWQWRGRNNAQDVLNDLQRVMLILDRKPPAKALVADEVSAVMAQNRWEHSSEYFRLRWFKNGNLHVWFTRDDLVREANKILAAHYGAVLAHA